MLMLSLALCLGIPDRIKDLEFNRIQEQWVYDTRTVHQFSQVLTAKEISFIRRLNCKEYDCRVDVQEEIAVMGDKALRLLFWATKSKEMPEVHTRATVLLNRLYRCEKQCTKDNYCPDCRGSRDYRYYVVEYSWDGFDQQITVLGERDIFVKEDEPPPADDNPDDNPEGINP